MTNVTATLEQRGERYGSFLTNATTAQAIKAAMHAAPGWEALAPDQKEGLEIIASKISRALTGDSTYVDNWHDIAGYAVLVEQQLIASRLTGIVEARNAETQKRRR